MWSVEKVVHRAPCQERSGVKIMRISNIQFTVHVHMYLCCVLGHAGPQASHGHAEPHVSVWHI